VNRVQVIDLPEEHRQLYFWCLEDWSDEAKEAGPGRSLWFERMKDRGLRVKLALDDIGEVGGMIQYLPIEASTVDGDGLYFVPCVWVHGYKHGRGNSQGKGMGKALLRSAEEDAKALGAKGIAAWGLRLPFWMQASWFKKQGYKECDRAGMMGLVWKPFSDDAEPPRWIKPKKKPQPQPGKVTVTAFVNGWCMGQNLVYERAKRAVAELGDGIEFREIDTTDRTTLMEWGIADALFIDDKQVRTGPPPSYDKIKGLIARKLKKVSA
jgi:GNAT superfamily N-acetyltransferase